MTSSVVKDQRICLSTLKSRGWTKTLIEKFAPEPMYVPNPHYKCSAEMQLFYLKDIEHIEKLKRFKTEFEKVLKKRERAKILAEAREEKCKIALKEQLDSVLVEQIPEKDLRKQAKESKCDYFCNRHNSCLWAYHNCPWVKSNQSSLPSPYYYDGDEYIANLDFMEEVSYIYAYGNVPEEEIRCWEVDYILFNLLEFPSSSEENYGSIRDEINRRKVSYECKQELKNMLNEKIYQLIAQEYPYLKDACVKQLKFKLFPYAEDLIYGPVSNTAG